MTRIRQHCGLIVSVAVLLGCTVSALGAEPARKGGPRKIVFLAGAPDGHGKGTHEYAKDLQLLKACLDTSPNLKGIRTEIHLDGWPKDQATLEDSKGDRLLFHVVEK